MDGCQGHALDCECEIMHVLRILYRNDSKSSIVICLPWFIYCIGRHSVSPKDCPIPHTLESGSVHCNSSQTPDCNVSQSPQCVDTHARNPSSPGKGESRESDSDKETRNQQQQCRKASRHTRQLVSRLQSTHPWAKTVVGVNSQTCLAPFFRRRSEREACWSEGAIRRNDPFERCPVKRVPFYSVPCPRCFQAVQFSHGGRIMNRPLGKADSSEASRRKAGGGGERMTGMGWDDMAHWV